MATQFIPYSVVMRGKGYVRVPRTQKWVPEEVMERMNFRAEAAKLSAPLRKMMREDPVQQALTNGVSWGELAQVAQDAADAPFIAMTDAEWHNYLRTDKSKSWEECQRLSALRAAKKAEAEVMPEVPKTCAYWYREYTRYPHLYFSSPAEQQAAIAELLADWRASVGRWRIGAMEAAAQKIQQAWREYRTNRQTFDATCYCNMCQSPESEPERCGDCHIGIAVDSLLDVPLCNSCVWELELNKETLRCQGCGNVCPRDKVVRDPAWDYTIGFIVCEGCSVAGRPKRQSKLHYCCDWTCPGDCGVLRCGCIDVCRCR